MDFKENLDSYLSNPKNRNKPLQVGDTPNALLAIGAKQLPVVINPNDVDKCLAVRTANKNKNSHNLSVGEFMALPELLENPVMIFKDPKNDYITIVTDKFDMGGKPIIIGVELNVQEKNHMVNRVATMHGRERAFESFIARNGKEVEGYIPRNITEGNLIALNIEKVPNYYQSTGLQLPEKYSLFVTYDNSITQSFDSVKGFVKNNLNFFKEENVMEMTKEKSELIAELMEDLKQGEPEDYGYDEGLKEIEEGLKSKSVEELRNQVAEIRQESVEASQEHVHEMSARVTPIESESKLKGIATVTFNDQVSVHGVKVVEGDKGLFLSMPGEKKGDKFVNHAIPKSSNALAKMKEVVLKAYDEAIVLGKRQDKSELAPTDIKMNVNNFRENPYKNNILGSCDVTVGDTLVIKDVKVIATKESGELSIALPTKKQDENGEYPSVVTATSSDSFQNIKAAVLDSYQNHLKTVIGNTPYNELGSEREVKTFNSEFAKKVGAELDADGVKWSGKIGDDGKTKITVNKDDSDKLTRSAENAKVKATEAKNQTQMPEAPDQTSSRRKK